jgi:O-antigen ligase
LSHTSRGRMFGGAWRAWQQSPVIGIGAGMHRNLWPSVAASADGDRETNRWPSLRNDTFHSYHVHNDWLQLLEEFGLIGLALVLLAAGALLLVYLRLLPAALPEAPAAPLPSSGAPFPLLLPALLAMVAMGFHSLGDFNLQMPATTWIFGCMLALPLGEALHHSPQAASPRSSR